MWRNHLTVGIRSLLRDPVFATINLVGLAIGIAGCLLIILFIRYETSFDDWLPDADRTVQFQQVFTSGQNVGGRSAMTPFVAASALPPQLPEIETATGVLYGNPFFRKGSEPLWLDNVYATDANFFQVLRLPFLHGDPARALADMNGIVLTEHTALQLLGRTDVLGRTVTQITPEGDKELRITGVLRDLPENTHLRLDAIYRLGTATGSPDNDPYASWNLTSGWVYARLRPGADLEAMNRRLPQILQRIVPASQRNQSAADRLGFTQEVVPLRSINTAEIDSGTMRAGTPAKTLVTFAIIAAFLLLVASVNFTNLATARASRRAREVGLRKTLGATRRQLIGQFLLEAMLTAAAAGLIGLVLVEFSLPLLNDLVGGAVQLNYFGHDSVLPPLIGLLLLIGLCGGAYPAFFLSRFQPAAVLKANKGSAEAPGTGRLRTALVVLQFAVSIALMICTAVIYGQTLYARSADPGYRASGLLFVVNPQDIGDDDQVATFLRRIEAIPGVRAAARSGVTPNPTSISNRSFRVPGAPESVLLNAVPVDGNTFRALGMRLLAGRTVTDQRDADVGASLWGGDAERQQLIEQRGLNVVLSEDALRPLGFRDAQQAIGRQLRPDSRLDGEGGQPGASYTVVGVVNAARFESMRFKSLPRVYLVAPGTYLGLAVRFEGDGAAIMSQIESLWKSSVTKSPFVGYFADRRIAAMYDRDERRGRLFAIFAGLAVLVSCLGLFGLAAFTAQRRTKEIGIRKVLGARVRDIIRLLVWQFTKPVVIANLIAWPVAWWAMRNWLSEFESRIDLTPTPFVFAGLLALVIAVSTIVGHAVKVARANPIHALRYE